MDSYPLENKTRKLIKAAKRAPEVAPCADRALYLDIAERIVRQAVEWLDAEGRVIDPKKGEVWVHTSPRFAASAAPLIHAGRCLDLLEPCTRNLDTAIRDFAAGRGTAHDFWLRDLALAMGCIGDRVDPGTLAEWRSLLASYDPYDLYADVLTKKKPEELFNWNMYAITGEQMRQRLGIGDSRHFIEEHLDVQQARFTPYGMYRDPNCPITYDLSVRQNLVLLLGHGYIGPNRAFLEEMARRGALTQLLFQSTTGEMPFGGRSNQFHHTEGMFCCVAEFEASRYARAGDALRAGVFKRAAHRAAAAVRRWVIDADPFRHTKNLYPQESLHGCDPYGWISGYALLASNLFALAALLADDTIEERPAPCDTGGYCLPILDDFHRVFASCGPLQVQIDTCGQSGYDATGLGRVHHRDHPSELGLSLGIVPRPHYTVTEPAFDRAVAIGPCWDNAAGARESLAASQPAHATVRVEKEVSSLVAFGIEYDIGRPVTERYELRPGSLVITMRVEGSLARCTVPLLLTNGAQSTSIASEDAAVCVTLGSSRFVAEALVPGTRLSRLNVRAPNRNGVYDIAVFECEGPEIAVRLRFA